MPARKPSNHKAPLDPLIFTNRGHRVMLDADLASLYGVSTKRFNEIFKRNRQRFPNDFAFQLSRAEFESVKSQFLAGESQPADSRNKTSNWSQFGDG